MKKRFYSVYFYISFIPLAIILLYSVYHATVGIRYTFLFTSHIIYGVEGFLYALFISGFVLFPAFFACLIYQITYLSKTKKENKKIMKKTLIITAGIALINIIIVAAVIISNQVQKFMFNENMKQRAAQTLISVNEMAKKSDAIVSYGDNNVLGDGMLNSGYNRDTFFIDYQSKTIAFFIEGKYYEYALLPKSISDKYSMQYQIAISPPGDVFTAYCIDDSSTLTSAISFTTMEGDVYSIEITDDENPIGVYLGLGKMWVEGREQILK